MRTLLPRWKTLTLAALVVVGLVGVPLGVAATGVYVTNTTADEPAPDDSAAATTNEGGAETTDSTAASSADGATDDGTPDEATEPATASETEAAEPAPEAEPTETEPSDTPPIDEPFPWDALPGDLLNDLKQWPCRLAAVDDLDDRVRAKAKQLCHDRPQPEKPRPCYAVGDNGVAYPQYPATGADCRPRPTPHPEPYPEPYPEPCDRPRTTTAHDASYSLRYDRAANSYDGRSDRGFAPDRTPEPACRPHPHPCFSAYNARDTFSAAGRAKVEFDPARGSLVTHVQFQPRPCEPEPQPGPDKLLSVLHWYNNGRHDDLESGDRIHVRAGGVLEFHALKPVKLTVVAIDGAFTEKVVRGHAGPHNSWELDVKRIVKAEGMFDTLVVKAEFANGYETRLAYVVGP